MAKPETITSAANPLLKDVRRAISRGSLTDQGCCVAETFHLLEEAQRSRCEIHTVLVSESAQAHLRGRPAKLVVLPDKLFASVAATETSQGVIALVRPPAWKLEELFGPSALVVVLDGLQDPGNAGTIVRAAEAFGATGILFLKGTVSPYNSKTLRASAGSLFRVPFLHGMDVEVARAALKQLALFAAVPPGAATVGERSSTPNEPRPLGSDPGAGSPGAPLRSRLVGPWPVDFTQPCGLIVGSEAHGVSAALRAAAVAVTIPTVGVESLNAAMAAGILLYEARRQRMRPA